MKNDEFIRGKVPITKEEVRAISLNKLNLKDAKTFIDVFEPDISSPLLSLVTIHQYFDEWLFLL